MDINLPGISGLTALRILAEDPETASIPVIALSANAMPSDIEKGLAAGFFRYLTKPIKVDKFMETLDGTLAFAKHQAGHPGLLRGAQSINSEDILAGARILRSSTIRAPMCCRCSRACSRRSDIAMWPRP